MIKILDQITDQLNLRWAWEKVRKAAIPGDIWINEVELAAFELELEWNLQSIADEFKKGHYKTAPLRPLPFPKNPDKNNSPQIRQCFLISIRDQVAWTAVVNVIGPFVDKEMPVWSYGNRLYRSIWVDEDENGQKRRKIGNYRHSSGRYYLPFRQSWPIYRRHIFLSTQAMSKQKHISDENDQDQQELELQKYLLEKYRCPFLISKYWEGKRPKGKIGELFWCAIDLAKFYPSIKLNIVIENIIHHLPANWKEQVIILLKSMLSFPLNHSDWSDEELTALSIKPGSKFYRHIPTGLYVAGFLANAGLLNLDKKAADELKNHKVAHFRYVDDHIILAFDFDSLVAWIDKYSELIKESKIGVKINYEKVEPAEFSTYLRAHSRKRNQQSKLKEIAKKKCSLDPEFPSPLMTKTIALVSNIAKTDFNLLEQNELSSLTEQLEHLLLVDLSEEEIPAKTRLSFAAGRLTKIAECLLANPVDSINIHSELALINLKLHKDKIVVKEREELENRQQELNKSLRATKDSLQKDISRIFRLLRKVLRDRPDRTRLWTRAILMCRLTGVDGLKDIFDDICKQKGPKIEEQLTYEALLANFYSLLSKHLIIAARSICDENIPEWKKSAAKSFIKVVLSLNLTKPVSTRWFLDMSWKQYCFGIYCSKLILDRCFSKQAFSFQKSNLLIGKNLLTSNTENEPAFWVWWASRNTLSDLNIHAEEYVKSLASDLQSSTKSFAFWSFFPLDLPDQFLNDLCNYHLQKNNGRDGWLFDAFRNRGFTSLPINLPKCFSMLINKKEDGFISFYEWCSFIKALPNSGIADPRNGEWTVLEITKQVISLINQHPIFGQNYIKRQIKSSSQLLCIHPANFRIPITWTQNKSKANDLTWDGWKKLIRSDPVAILQEDDCIIDYRYTPLIPEKASLFREINPVRGIGLILYGLLKCGFDLPAIWNGPGHSDMLSMLPKLLLNEITCSSWTLGILQGCLSTRANENRFIKLFHYSLAKDDDTLRDPIQFDNYDQVRKAISKAQRILESYQMATLQYNARQLIPISIKQLTNDFNWQKAFEDIEEFDGN